MNDRAWAKANGVCYYCNVAVTRETGTVDHVMPKSAGGKRKPSNLVIACVPCNDRKANKSATKWVENSAWLRKRIINVAAGVPVLLPKVGEPARGPRGQRFSITEHDFSLESEATG